MSCVTRNVLLECFEGETPRVVGTLYDHEGELVPDELITSVYISIYDFNSKSTLRTATQATTSNSTWEIWLTDTETAMMDQSLDYEYKVVTVRATYLSGVDTRHANTEAFIKVKNLAVYSP
jgi:hypothetical protein